MSADPTTTSGDAVRVAAEAVAAAVSSHPGVARLDAGPFGTVASLLPGRRVVGVRLPPAPGAAAEIAVVAHAGTPLPGLATELGVLVHGVLGEVSVDVTVVDVVPAPGAAAVVEVVETVVLSGLPDVVAGGPGRHSGLRPVT